MSGTGERIEDFIEATRAHTNQAGFVAAFPHPFLVREATAAGEPPAAGEDRRTARVSRVAPPVGDDFARQDVWIYRVRPRAVGDGPVTLGRDAGCDVVVDDPTVSLVHARISHGPAAADDDDDDGPRYFVCDVGSSNGTFVDGAQAPAERPVALEDQGSVRFGPQAKFQFFTAGGFFQFLDFYRRIKKRGT
ncbi:MAG: FHA domain-containing protein [Planctomycetes bacterium]|nr:FHA domain-containing protein [Planctomycetota bacterium]